MALKGVGCISKSFTLFVINKRAVGDIARETEVLWEEKSCFTCTKEEIGQAQPQLYGASYFFVRKTLLGPTAILKRFTAVECLLQKAELDNISMMTLNVQRHIYMACLIEQKGAKEANPTNSHSC